MDDSNSEVKSNRKIIIITLVAIIFICFFLTICCSVNLYSYKNLADGCYQTTVSKVYLEYEVRESWDDWFPSTEKIEVVGADAMTFKNIESSNCWVSKKTKELKFQAIAIDKENVYVRGLSVDGISPDGFRALENKTVYNYSSFFANNEDVYLYDTVSDNLKSLNLDPTKTIILEDGYIKDDVSVYHYGNKVNSTNPIGFKVLDVDARYSYASDGENVFQASTALIIVKSPSTWEFISDTYSKDAYNVYSFPRYGDKSLKLVPGADPDTFISGYELTDENYKFKFDAREIPYGKDDKYVYYESEQVYGANPDKLQPINFGFWSDDENVYYKTKIVPGAKPYTFKPHEFMSAVGTDTSTGEEFSYVPTE